MEIYDKKKKKERKERIMEYIFNVLTMIGGLCLFLFGMKVMGQALEVSAGNNLRNILAKLTNKKSAGFFVQKAC